MPRLKKTKLNPLAGLDARRDVRELLESGHYFSILSPRGVDTPPGDDVLAAAWQLLGDTITAEYVRQHPGERPAGWWKDGPGASEPRRCLRRGRLGPIGQRLCFGVPSMFGAAGGDPNAAGDLPVYESQRDYLTRRGLLTEGEH